MPGRLEPKCKVRQRQEEGEPRLVKGLTKVEGTEKSRIEAVPGGRCVPPVVPSEPAVGDTGPVYARRQRQ